MSSGFVIFFPSAPSHLYLKRATVVVYFYVLSLPCNFLILHALHYMWQCVRVIGYISPYFQLRIRTQSTSKFGGEKWIWSDCKILWPVHCGDFEIICSLRLIAWHWRGEDLEDDSPILIFYLYLRNKYYTVWMMFDPSRLVNGVSKVRCIPYKSPGFWAHTTVTL